MSSLSADERLERLRAEAEREAIAAATGGAAGAGAGAGGAAGAGTNSSTGFTAGGGAREASPTSQTRRTSTGAPTTGGRGWRITLNAPVVLVFATLCCLATALGYATGGATDTLLFATYHSSLADPLTYVRFFTHTLGHSGWEHLLGNMAFILLLGPLLEEKYGGRNLLIIMAITALCCALVNYVLFPGQGLMGASGIVFAFILLASITDAHEGEIPVTFILVALIYLGQQVYQGVFITDNISQLSHIIGGVVGAVAGFVLMGRR